MTANRFTEIEMELVVLHFAVHQLLVAHCERETNPVAFALGLLTDLEETFDTAPSSTDLPEDWQAQIRERSTAFFGQVVSTLLTKTARHDA